MKSREELKRHAGLLDGMARQVGADLETAVLAGCLTLGELADAVLRCADCPSPDHCAGLQQAGEAREEAPGYCRNRSLLNDLKAVT